MSTDHRRPLSSLRMHVAAAAAAQRLTEKHRSGKMKERLALRGGKCNSAG